MAAKILLLKGILDGKLETVDWGIEKTVTAGSFREQSAWVERFVKHKRSCC